MLKVILMHGKSTSPSEKWYPWFAEQAEKFGWEYHAPALPKTDDPVMSEWKQCLADLNPDDNTVLVGHSRGGVAILRWLEDQPTELKVRKVILVATNSGLLKNRAIKSESNYGFYTENGYDFAKIKQHCNDFVVFHSTDDEWVPYEAGTENAAGLNAKLLTFKDRGHFGKKISEIPELLEEINRVK